MSPKRQLAAIMFADIVGYTAMMQSDEKKAKAVRKRHRSVFEELHAQHQGKIIQYYGDGVLSIFDSAVQATQCAIEIQQRLRENPAVPLRIGLHMGDIVYDDTEVYGDGVNFASRIESMGASGAILVSDRLNEELRNHPSISTTSLGLFNLKNIERSVEVFAISNEGIKVPDARQMTSHQTHSKTIAVLPFANFSGGEESEFFSDGITEEIINALARIEQLKVTSRTSSFFFKGKHVPLREIGEKLNVSTILEGSVRRAGDQLRITAQLIDVREDYHFWSETWDRKLENIFDIQDEISLLIADKLREHFGHLEVSDHLVTRPTESLDAYEYCLKAKYQRNKWNPEDVHEAITYYQKALEIDPNYSDALVGLADCYSFLGTIGSVPFEEGWGKTMEYIWQAQAMGNQSSGLYYQLSNLAFFTECDYGKSLTHMHKAIEINPNNADAQQFLSFLYILAGKVDISERHLQVALAINPLLEETQFFRAYWHYMCGEYEKSLTLLDTVLAANDKNIPAHSIKPLCLLKLGRYEEVFTYCENIPKQVVIEGEKIGHIGLAHALKKDAEAHIYMEKLTKMAGEPNGFTADSYLFFMFSVMGETDKAFEWVETALKKKSSLVLIRYPDPIAEGLRTDGRYKRFFTEMFKTQAVKSKPRSQNALLDEDTAARYERQVEQYVEEHKPYLNPECSLRGLADALNIHPNHLSWIINNRLGKNFNDYINGFRVEDFKQKSQDGQNAHLTIEGKAYESGFSSKTVFNTCFKRMTGMTPKQFLQQ